MPQKVLADMLSFLSTKSEGIGFNEIARHLAQLGYTPLYTAKSTGQLRLHPKTLKSILDDASGKALVESDYPLGRTPKGKRNLFRLTKKGGRFLTRHKIRSMWGFAGLKWAESLWNKGYEIQFLNHLTGLQAHENFLFAWHPTLRDFRILQFFVPREYPKGRLRGLRLAQDPTKPVGQRIEESNSIERFVLKEVGKEFTEERISKALQKFFDYPTTHNCFYALLMPSEEIHFGMPMIGNFESALFLKIGYEDLPLVPQMLEFQPVILVRPVSESVQQQFHVKLDIGKLNKWLENSVREKGLPETGTIAFYNTLVCKHNDGEHNVGGRCKLGTRSRCNFERAPDHYEPPCERIMEELGFPLHTYKVTYRT